MEKFDSNPEDRSFFGRLSPRGALPHLLLFYLALALMVFRVSSCTGLNEDSFPPDFDAHVVDSAIFRISAVSSYDIGSVDFLIFKDDASRSFEALIHSDTTVVEYSGPRGGKLVVVVGNCRYAFRETALKTFDSAEQLVYQYADDSPDRPLLSASGWIEMDSDNEISINPLLCSVSIGKITNSMSGYRRLEDPRIFLKNVSAGAEILKESGFYPAETFSDTTGLKGYMWDALPYDVGMNPQTPGTTLWFYPNSNENSKTFLIFEYDVKGKTYRYELALPSSSRGRKFTATLSVREPDDYTFSVN